MSDAGDTYDVECVDCGHVGLHRTEVPSPGGPKTMYECPVCGSYTDEDRYDGGSFVSKR
jgi:hypothetical protein